MSKKLQPQLPGIPDPFKTACGGIDTLLSERDRGKRVLISPIPFSTKASKCTFDYEGYIVDYWGNTNK